MDYQQPTVDWLPTGKYQHEALTDQPNLRIWNIRSPTLEFDTIPSGWRIEIDITHSSKLTIAALKIGSGVTIGVQNPANKRLKVDGPFRVLEIQRVAQNACTVELTTSQVIAHLDGGVYKFEGDHRFAVVAKDPGRPLTIGGTAKVRKLSGEGNVHVKSRTCEGLRIEHLHGSATFDSELSKANITAPNATIVCQGNVSEASIEARQLKGTEFHGCVRLQASEITANALSNCRIHASKIMEVVQSLTDSTVKIDDAPDEQERCGLTIGTFAQTPQLNGWAPDLVPGNEGWTRPRQSKSSEPKSKTRGTMTRSSCELEGGKHLAVAGDVDASTVDAEGTVLVGGNLTASAERTVTVKAGRHLRIDGDVLGCSESTLRSDGDMLLTGSVTTLKELSAWRGLRIDGPLEQVRSLTGSYVAVRSHVENASITASLQVEEGHDHVQQPVVEVGQFRSDSPLLEDFSLEIISDLAVAPEEPKAPAQVQGQGASVKSSNLMAEDGGHIAISGDLQASKLGCEGNAWIAGDCSALAEERYFLRVGGDLYIDGNLKAYLPGRIAVGGSAYIGGAVRQHKRIRARNGLRVSGDVVQVGTICAKTLVFDHQVAHSRIVGEDVVLRDGLLGTARAVIIGHGVWQRTADQEARNPEGQVDWRPWAASATLSVEAPLDTLRVGPWRLRSDSQEPVAVTIEGDARVNELSVSRNLTIKVPGNQSAAYVEELQPEGNTQLRLELSSCLNVNELHVVDQSVLRCDIVSHTDGECCAAFNHIQASERVELSGDGTTSVSVGNVGRACNTPLRLRGGASYTLEGTFLGRVQSVADDVEQQPSSTSQVPLLTVPKNSAVTALAGEVRIGQVDGRVWGEARRRKRPSRNKRETPAPAPVLRRLEEQSKESSGHLFAVDPTKLPYEQLGNIAGVHLFEPHGRDVIDFAKDAAKQSDPTRLEQAQHFNQLVNCLHGRAASGSSWSATRWAAARVHHSTVRLTERALRFLHRLVGYGQRPGPAIATWFVLAISVATVDVGVRGDFSSTMPALTDWWQSLATAIVLPLAIFRLVGDETPILFASAHLHAAAWALLAGALAYVVVASKNYLSTPAERPSAEGETRYRS